MVGKRHETKKKHVIMIYTFYLKIFLDVVKDKAAILFYSFGGMIKQLDVFLK